MKYLIAIILTFTLQFSNAQMSGIPEQDALLELKDKLYLKYNLSGISLYPAPNPDEYLWVEYQWLQWVNGRTKFFECKYSHASSDGKLLFFKNEWSSYNCIGDTLVKVPLPISCEGFMDWKVKEALKSK